MNRRRKLGVNRAKWRGLIKLTLVTSAIVWLISAACHKENVFAWPLRGYQDTTLIVNHSEVIPISKLAEIIGQDCGINVYVEPGNESRLIYLSDGKYKALALLYGVSTATGLGLRPVGNAYYFVGRNHLYGDNVLSPRLSDESRKSWRNSLKPVTNILQSDIEKHTGVSFAINRRGRQLFASLPVEQHNLIKEKILNDLHIPITRNTEVRMDDTYALRVISTAKYSYPVWDPETNQPITQFSSTFPIPLADELLDDKTYFPY